MENFQREFYKSAIGCSFRLIFSQYTHGTYLCYSINSTIVLYDFLFVLLWKMIKGYRLYRKTLKTIKL